MKNTVMPKRISVSFRMVAKPTPLSIIAFTMITNHLAGITLLMTWRGKGILLMGKIKPESSIVGSINPISEIIIAFCCVFVIVDINIPKESDVIINKMLSADSNSKLPFNGM